MGTSGIIASTKQENIIVLHEGTTIKVNGIPVRLLEDVYVSGHINNLKLVQEYLHNKNLNIIGE